MRRGGRGLLNKYLTVDGGQGDLNFRKQTLPLSHRFEGPPSRAEGPSLPQSQVADFGMSMNIRANKTHVSGVRQGTPLYISPEILHNGKASKAADV